MQLRKSGGSRTIAEQFDLNAVKAAGTITKLWGRNGDVFARLHIPHEDATYVTLRIPDGLARGEPVTLKAGDAIRISGYLSHVAYVESLRRFLEAAGEQDFFEEQVPPDDLDFWRAIVFRRQNALVNVLDLDFESAEALNFADLEGVIAKVWEYPRERETDVFIRVACYDEHAPAGSGTRNFGRVVRLPHYVNIRFPGGRTANGSAVTLKPKQRLRARGELRDGGRPVTLRDQLNGLGSSEVVEALNRLKNPELLSQISATQESLHVLANAMVLYSK